MEQAFLNAQAWLWGAAVVAMAILLGILLHRLTFSIAARITARTHSIADDSLIRHARRPARLLFPLAAVFIALPAAPLPPIVTGPLQHGAGLLLIAGVGW